MKKIIFLDIDGVLNHELYYDKIFKTKELPKEHLDVNLDPFSVSLINKLCEETNSKIVISSSWRLDKQCLEKLILGGLNKEYIYDMLPFSPANKFLEFHKDLVRGDVIKNYMLEINTNIDKYVIIDDDIDFLEEQLPFFINTNADLQGFNEECYKKALKILNYENN